MTCVRQFTDRLFKGRGARRRAAAAAMPAALVAVWAGALLHPAASLATSGPGNASGTITAIQGSSFTIQTGGRPTGVINALTLAAAALARGNYPYVWGGGHAQAGVAGVGIPGPGHNGKLTGFDCSGSIAAVLAGAGLWAAGGGVPADNGVIATLLREGLIARGAGQAPNEVTLYDKPGVHIFMNIDGRFFGTSDGAAGGNSRGGPGWLSDGAPDAYSRAYRQYHFLPAVLRDKTSYGHAFTFQVGAVQSLLPAFQVGDPVQVGYRSGGGAMSASTITWVGATTATGTVTAVASDGSSVTLQNAAGESLTLSAARLSGGVGSVETGDTVQVVYTQTKGLLSARQLTVTATPVVTQATGTITAIASDLSSVTIQTADGQALTLATGTLTGLLSGLQVGAAVHVSYLDAAGTLALRQIAAAPGGPTGSGSGSSGSGYGGGTYGGGYGNP